LLKNCFPLLDTQNYTEIQLITKTRNTINPFLALGKLTLTDNLEILDVITEKF